MSKELDRFVEIYAKFKTGIDDLYTSLEAAGYTLPEDRSFANLKAPVKEIIESGGGAEPTPVNLLKAPVTAESASDEVETLVKLDYSLGLEVGKKYRIRGTLGTSIVLDSVGEYKDQGGGMYQLIGYYPDEETADCAFIIFDKVSFDEAFEPVLDDNSAVIMFSVSNAEYAPSIINSITEAVESTTTEPIIVEASDITSMFMEEDGIMLGYAIANASMKGWEALYTMGDKIEMVLNGSSVNLELFQSEDDMFVYYQEGFDMSEDPYESGNPLAIVQVLLNYRTTEDFDMVEEQGTVGFMIQLLNPTNGTSTTIDKIILPPISYKDLNARVSSVVLGDAYPQFDLSRVYSIGQYGFAGYGSANHSPFDIHIPANIIDMAIGVFTNANINKITFDENALKDSYIMTYRTFEDTNIRDGENSNIDVFTKNLTSVSERCFSGFNASSLRLNFDKLYDFGEASFKRASVKSVNSDTTGEWLFGSDEADNVHFYEGAFRECTTDKLRFIYPNAKSVSFLGDKQFYWNGYGYLTELEIQVHPECSTFILNEDRCRFMYNTKLIAPRAEVSKPLLANLTYLDCYKIIDTEKYLSSASFLETLVYRDVEQSFVPSDVLGSYGQILSGTGVVYVQDNLVDSYKTTYADTSIVFRGISELA